MAARTTFFATTAPGLEPVLHREAKALGLPKLERQVGGVLFEGGAREMGRANLELRTAIRVLRRLARFPAPDADALYAGVIELPWEEWLAPEGTLVVDAQSRDSALTHTRFVEQRTKDAIVDRLRRVHGARPSVERDGADLCVHVHLTRDRATVSLDSSGDSLHKRGWRVHQGTAPLSETLAAGCVQLAEWDGRSPLIDPFAGSGTLVIEAAHLALGRAPGLGRAFAFERWPEHDARAWQRLVDEARARVVARPKLRLFASDIDAERIEEARVNVQSAGVEAVIELDVADARALDPRRGWNALVLSNLPYGVRVGADVRVGPDDRFGPGAGARERVDVEGLYRDFGRVLAERCGGFRAALLVAEGGPAASLGLRPHARHRLQNGALAVELLVAQLDAAPAGAAQA